MRATLLLAAFLLAPASLAAPVALATLDGSLPAPRFGALALELDDGVYVLHGAEHVCYCFLGDVVRYDPTTGSAEVVAQLEAIPDAWLRVWDSDRVHFFGVNGVWHVDPRSGETTMTAPRPVLNGAHAAHVVGDRIFIFRERSPVFVYDALNDDLEARLAKTPSGTRYAQTAVVDGFVYFLGGDTAAIRRYDPVLDRFETMAAELPFALSAAGTVWTGEHILMAGGITFTEAGGAVFHSTILAYDPVADEVSVLGVLPTPSFSQAAVWLSDAALLVGGSCVPCLRAGPPAHSGPSQPSFASDLLGETLQTELVLRVTSLE